MNTWNVSLAAGLISVAMATQALGETPIWSVEETQAAIAENEVILLDIRSPDEWSDTGLASGALPISLHEPSFIEKIQAVLKIGKPVALICATGGRTKYVTDVLEKNGVSGVIDVSEGMMGNPRGAGWLAKGLPIVDTATAEAAYRSLISN